MRRVAEINEALYSTFASPWVKAMSNPWTAQTLHWLHPMRLKTWMFSETFLPWMRPFAVLAAAIAGRRRALPDDRPLVVQERRLIEQVSTFWEVISVAVVATR